MYVHKQLLLLTPRIKWAQLSRQHGQQGCPFILLAQVRHTLTCVSYVLRLASMHCCASRTICLGISIILDINVSVIIREIRAKLHFDPVAGAHAPVPSCERQPFLESGAEAPGPRMCHPEWLMEG